VFDLAHAYPPVNTFCIARFADFERRVDEDFNKIIGADHRTAFVARVPVGADGCTDHKAAVPHNLRRDKSYPADIQIAVCFAEAKSLRKMRPHHVAVEHSDLPSVFEELNREDVCRS
jgi:hypothetical protein